jgi:hypothetical protein
MQAKTLRQANGQALILQQPGVVSSQQAEDLGKDKALQGYDVIVHQEAFDGTLPLRLEGIDVLTIARLRVVSICTKCGEMSGYLHRLTGQRFRRQG